MIEGSWYRAEAAPPFHKVAIEGCGPFQLVDMVRYLRRFGLETASPFTDAQALIVGRIEFDKRILEGVLAQRGEEFRIYSQEMILAYSITGIDPWDDPDEWSTLLHDHPAIALVLSMLRRRADTSVPEAAYRPDALDFPVDLGVLRALGYRVGHSGLSQKDRRKVLEAAFCLPNGRLPDVAGQEYMREWGQARGEVRLRKIANSLASFCRTAKMRRNPPRRAISEWREDLAWLKGAFYDPYGFSFEWPRVRRLKGLNRS